MNTFQYCRFFVTHNLAVFIGMCMHELYKLYDPIPRAWFIMTGKGGKGEYHMKKYMESMTRPGRFDGMHRTMFAHGLALRLGWTEEKAMAAGGAFDPVQTSFYVWDKDDAQWVQLLERLTTVGDMFKGLYQLGASNERSLRWLMTDKVYDEFIVMTDFKEAKVKLDQTHFTSQEPLLPPEQ